MTKKEFIVEIESILKFWGIKRTVVTKKQVYDRVNNLYNKIKEKQADEKE